MKLEDIILPDKDYQDENGYWVIVCDAELWERTNIQKSTQPQPAHIDMNEDWIPPNQTTMYPAREHWVTTTAPFRVTTPKEEYEKIQKRQKEIYWEIVNEFLEWYKTEFLAGLKNAPDEKGFLESELEDWRNYKFPRDVIKGWRHFDKIVPRCLEEKFLIVKGKSNNYQPKEEARYRFFKWLEKYRLSDEVPMTLVISTESEKEGLKIRTIYISDENIESIYNALAPYFKGEETKLKQLLEGKAIEGKVRFNESAKVLCNTFNTLYEAGRIGATIEQIKVWLCKYFQTNRKPFELKEGGTLNRYFQEKIEMEGQILLPTIKGLITFDKT